MLTSILFGLGVLALITLGFAINDRIWRKTMQPRIERESYIVGYSAGYNRHPNYYQVADRAKRTKSSGVPLSDILKSQ